MPRPPKFSAKKKAGIVQWILDFNQAHGRGGMAGAVKKYKVSWPTIISWTGQGKATAQDAALVKPVKVAAQAAKEAKSPETSAAPAKRGRPRKTAEAPAVKITTGLGSQISGHLSNIDKFTSDIASLQAALTKEKNAVAAILAKL